MKSGKLSIVPPCHLTEVLKICDVSLYAWIGLWICEASTCEFKLLSVTVIHHNNNLWCLFSLKRHILSNFPTVAAEFYSTSCWEICALYACFVWYLIYCSGFDHGLNTACGGERSCHSINNLCLPFLNCNPTLSLTLTVCLQCRRCLSLL